MVHVRDPVLIVLTVLILLACGGVLLFQAVLWFNREEDSSAYQ